MRGVASHQRCRLNAVAAFEIESRGCDFTLTVRGVRAKIAIDPDRHRCPAPLRSLLPWHFECEGASCPGNRRHFFFAGDAFLTERSAPDPPPPLRAELDRE